MNDVPTRQAEAQLFLQRLDPDAEFFTFQTFDDDKERAKKFKDDHGHPDPKLTSKPLHGTLLDHWDELEKRNQLGAGIFITVNATNGRGRLEGDIERVRSLFVDLDGAPLLPVLDWELKPQIVTNTSEGKWHCYWLVDYFPKGAFVQTQEFLIQEFDADDLKDLPRVLRLPGFHHMKDRDNPWLVEINREASNFDIENYSHAAFVALMPKPEPEHEVGGDEIIYMDNGKRKAADPNDFERKFLDNLDAWVPVVFPGRCRKTRDGYRITSRALGRENEEDLSITRKGIKDFGVHDIGDEAKGKRLPSDLVMEYMQKEGEKDRYHAVVYLCGLCNIDPPQKRPHIVVKQGQMAITADAAEQVLIDAGVQIYVRANSLVYPIIGKADAAYGRRTTTARLSSVDLVWLRGKLSRFSQFQKYNAKNKLLPCDPPDNIVAEMLGRRDAYPFPDISGIITTPTLRPDGSLLSEAGYDESTGFLLIEPPKLPPIPDHPTRRDAQEALKLLTDLLTEFPFVNEDARATALSAIITPVARGGFSVAPMHAARAPAAGTGKSYLWDLVSLIATGRLMPVMTLGKDEEETRKQLDAALLAGNPIISIDNVNGMLSGDRLNQTITQTTVEIRPLGKSELARVDTRGVSVYCTGNNISFKGDLNRRTVTSNLNPNVERPELREFRGNPVKAILRDRGLYVAACLTICRAHLMAKPGNAKPLASFDGWSDTVRSALIWLGCGDPVATQDVAREEDLSLVVRRELYTAWAQVMGVGKVNAMTMSKFLERVNETDASTRELRWPDLFNTVRSASGSRRDNIDQTRFGYYLRDNNNTIVGDFKLMSEPNRMKTKEWWIENVVTGHSSEGKYSTMRNVVRFDPSRRAASTEEPDVPF